MQCHQKQLAEYSTVSHNFYTKYYSMLYLLYPELIYHVCVTPNKSFYCEIMLKCCFSTSKTCYKHSYVFVILSVCMGYILFLPSCPYLSLCSEPL